MEINSELPVLTSEEVRVLGSLIEKSKTTPDYYPMTVNSITLACNQKSSRNPIVQYDEETVLNAINNLKRIGLISTATGGSSRSLKYKHNLTLVFPLSTAEVAVLCLLFLRGPLTAGEINSNSGRLYEFESLDEVNAVLDKLMNAEKPLLKQLPRRSGQKEARYVHLLSDFIDIPSESQVLDTTPKQNNELETRIASLENELADLKSTVDKLMKELMG